MRYRARVKRTLRALGIAAVPALFACTRASTHAASDANDGGADALEAVSAIAMDAASDAAIDEKTKAREAPATWAEAPRRRITKLDEDPALKGNADAIREHFGGTLPAAMRLQTAVTGGNARALLLAADGDDPKPIVLMVDERGGLVWKKDRPIAGIVPNVTQLAIASRPMGGAVLFLYDEPTHVIAARVWDAEGFPFADFQLFSIERCDALSAMRWPGRGWIAVASRPGGARAQLLRENGVVAWGEHGSPVGTAWRAAAPAAIVADTDESWMLVQHAPARGAPIGLSPDHLLAFRYDARGTSLWETPVDLGAVAHVEKTGDRIAIERARLGAARLVADGHDIEITSDGAVSAK